MQAMQAKQVLKTILHKANTRGHANHGWLDSYHTFSFAGYHDPQRIHFGALRVLNDDTVAGGEGFGRHPHKDMEIISIPLEGMLAHSDSMGNSGTISKGEIQVMSAGTGVLHSEMNATDQPVKFLQIWIIPNKAGVRPRYDQIRIDAFAQPDEFQQILSPDPDDAGVWIHQDAWFHLVDLSAGTDKEYRLKKEGNGVYVFVIDGNAEVAGTSLETRDGLGVWDTDALQIKANTRSELLLMEVPMEI